MTGKPVILLTGASGFLGAPLVPTLIARGFHVHALAHRHRGLDRPGLTWHTADLLQQGTCEQLLASLRPSHLLHAAWKVEHGKFWTAPENEDWRQAGLALLDAFIAAGGRRALFLGSCAEYDWDRTDGNPWREDDPCRPATPYGIAKHRLHLEVQEKAHHAGISLAWARLFLLFGAAENPARLIPSLISGLRAGQAVPLSSGRQIRDFSDTQDIAEALACMVQGGATGAVNVASGQGVTIRQVAEDLADLLGADRALLQFGALPDRHEPISMVADVTRLRQEVGAPAPPPLRQRLAELVARG